MVTPTSKPRLTKTEVVFICQTLNRLAKWEPNRSLNITGQSRKKRFLDILAGIGSIVNTIQIKKIKKNIRILQVHESNRYQGETA